MGIETLLSQIPLPELDESLGKLRGDQIDELPSEFSSEEDDKTSEAFRSFKTAAEFKTLPNNVQ